MSWLELLFVVIGTVAVTLFGVQQGSKNRDKKLDKEAEKILSDIDQSRKDRQETLDREKEEMSGIKKKLSENAQKEENLKMENERVANDSDRDETRNFVGVSVDDDKWA